MKLLAIDTSAPQGSLALLDEGALVWERSFESDRAHNAVIFAPLEAALEVADARGGFHAVVVGTGPGSYSGVRVGIAVATGLSVARGVSRLGLPSLPAFGERDSAAVYHVVGDARRSAYAFASIDPGAGPTALISPRLPELLEKAETEARIVAAQEAGEAVYTSEASLAEAWAELGVVRRFPAARRLAELAGELPTDGFESLAKASIEPLYLRAPYITTPRVQGA